MDFVYKLCGKTYAVHAWYINGRVNVGVATLNLALPTSSASA